MTQQLLLGLVAPAITKGAARFQAETLRRGGPYEVQGRRWKKSRPAPTSVAPPSTVVDAMAWKKKAW